MLLRTVHVYPLCVGSVGYQPSILVSCLRVGSFAWDIIKALAMLPFIASDHVDRLLEKIEIEVLVGNEGEKLK